MDRKVVVTGLGLVTPIGIGKEQFWDSLIHGRSGVRRITQFDPSGFDCQIAAEIPDFDPKAYFKNPKDARRTDRFAQLAMAAAKLCLEDSGIDLGSVNLDRFGVVVGSGIGGLKTMEEQHQVLLEKGPDRISPFLIPMLISNMASGLISMEYGLGGPNMSVVTACATANNSIGEAWRMIQHGESDVMLAGGAEATIVPLGIGGFCAMKALSTRNDEPERASRPFDRDRDGFVMGEAAGILLIEEEKHARKRGARIYAEIAGYGLSADAYHMTSPHPEGLGAARCMRNAISQAGLNPEDIDYVNAHGTSTGLGDVCETRAIKEVFGDHARNGLMVSSTKSMTGHLLGAAGSVEMAASVLAIQHGIIPPTINLDNPDPECDLDYVPHTAREKKIRNVINNSFGFGGHNATLLARAYE